MEINRPSKERKGVRVVIGEYKIGKPGFQGKSLTITLKKTNYKEIFKIIKKALEEEEVKR